MGYFFQGNTRINGFYLGNTLINSVDEELNIPLDPVALWSFTGENYDSSTNTAIDLSGNSYDLVFEEGNGFITPNNAGIRLSGSVNPTDFPTAQVAIPDLQVNDPTLTIVALYRNVIVNQNIGPYSGWWRLGNTGSVDADIRREVIQNDSFTNFSTAKISMGNLDKPNSFDNPLRYTAYPKDNDPPVGEKYTVPVASDNGFAPTSSLNALTTVGYVRLPSSVSTGSVTNAGFYLKNYLSSGATFAYFETLDYAQQTYISGSIPEGFVQATNQLFGGNQVMDVDLSGQCFFRIGANATTSDQLEMDLAGIAIYDRKLTEQEMNLLLTFYSTQYPTLDINQ